METDWQHEAIEIVDDLECGKMRFVQMINDEIV
jgi:hypothetical protein